MTIQEQTGDRRRWVLRGLGAAAAVALAGVLVTASTDSQPASACTSQTTTASSLAPVAPNVPPTSQPEGLSAAASRADVSGWTAAAESGSVLLSSTQLTDGPGGVSTAIDIQRAGELGRWAFALARLERPRELFTVGRTYRIQLWVRDLGNSGETIGISLADGSWGSRPTDETQFTSGPTTTWRLLTRTFVARARGEVGTGLYVTLPTTGGLHWQVAGASVRNVPEDTPPRTTAPASRRLTWPGSAGAGVDPCVWTRETGGNGWGNGELQTYTASERNAAVDGYGNLVITARQETVRGTDDIVRDFTSARLSTLGKASIPAGSYVEAAIQAPAGSGLWPAFWLIGADFPRVGWPASGELDIFEGGGNAVEVRNAVHTSASDDPTEHVQFGWGGTGGTVTVAGGVDAALHRYGVYFDSSIVQFFVDRELVRTVRAEDATAAGWAWPFGRPQCLVLNVAVNGWQKTTDTPFPESMVVGPIGVWRHEVPI